MPVIRVIPAEHPDGTSGGASSGSSMDVPVVLVCGYQCGVPGKSGSSLTVVPVWGSQQGDPGAASC